MEAPYDHRHPRSPQKNHHAIARTMFLPSCEYHALTTDQAPSEHHALKIMPAAARHALATMRSPPCVRKYTTTIQSPPGKHHEIKNIQTRHNTITTRMSPPGTMQSFPGKHRTTTTIQARHQQINTRSPAPCSYHRASTMR